MTIKELSTILLREIKEIKQTFADFKKNEFLHLERKFDNKFDNLAKVVYIGFGIVITIQAIIMILAQVLF